MMVLKIIGFVLVVAFVVGIVISNPAHIAIKYYGLELEYQPTVAETVIFAFLLGLLIATIAFMLDKSRLASKARKQEKILQVAQDEIARLRLKVMGEPEGSAPNNGEIVPAGKTKPTPSTGKKTTTETPTIATSVPSTSPSTPAMDTKPQVTPPGGSDSQTSGKATKP